MNRYFALVLSLMLLGTIAARAVTPGSPAPEFSAADSHGTRHKLSDYRGRFIVLEWHNPSCPFVVSQYANGKMQSLQKKWTKKTVLWFRVNSSAPGKEGYLTDLETNASAKRQRTLATATFLDPEGALGKKYGAKTTPHMFIIDPKGKLIYDGAIDNAPREDKNVRKNAEGESYVNYVDKALKEAMKGKSVSIPFTAAYGCSVKYKD